MIVRFEVVLDSKSSQLVFGELQTVIHVKLVNAEEIARRTCGLVYFIEDADGTFIVEDCNKRAILAPRGNLMLKSKIRDKLFELAISFAIRQKKKEITIDAREIFDSEMEKAIAHEMKLKDIHNKIAEYENRIRELEKEIRELETQP